MIIPDSRRNHVRVKGSAMVETIIVLPILLMLLFGVAEFSLVFSRWQTVSNAAREGARTAVVFRAPCVTSTVESDVRARVRAYTSSAGITLADDQIQISGVCGDPTTNSSVQVTVPYRFRVVGAMAPSLSPTIDTVGTSVMRNEGTG
jgi:Flp pilus assembly protein TadG